jgi:hypothetical protein
VPLTCFLMEDPFSLLIHHIHPCAPGRLRFAVVS